MSEPLDLDGIEARANAATPGPWTADGPWWNTDHGIGLVNDADSEHIASVDPPTTLALVAEVRALRAKVAEVMPEVEMWREHFLDDVREVERRNAAAPSEPVS